jgi:DtxR family transcriptional regulator, Mn-dependent transcriptional regulator
VTDAAASHISYHPVEHHPPVEEYLQAIESLNEEGTPAIQARLAERLGRSAPTVSEVLDRLATDGYVERAGRTITLTEQGQDVAQTVLRKHRLAERLLVDVIGLPWHLVHDEAGRWEHVISDEVMTRLTEVLGDPATCPHGNPIPGSANRTGTPSSQVSLAEVEPGQKVRFERLGEEVELDSATLRYLDDTGFIPGAVASVTKKGPDGALLLDADGTTLVLGTDLCHRLYVVVL